jgi:hypothetical protein
MEHCRTMSHIKMTNVCFLLDYPHVYTKLFKHLITVQ